jgi:arginine deiminase
LSSEKAIDVTSEIGKLKTVLLHRPGRELQNITPDFMERLLFDDIPDLEAARKEHDNFAKILKDNGVEVLYLEELAAESIEDKEIREKFVEQFLEEAHVSGEGTIKALKEHFSNLNNKELIDTLMAGVRKTDLKDYNAESLADMASSDYPLVLDPLTNLYFTRDPFATIGTGITINQMRTETRNRETIFAEYIFKYHPRFKDAGVPIWLNRDEKTSIEGGDELVLSEKVLAIGISQRTDAASVEKLAKKLFENNESFETILAFDIPKSRAFMHLDTVFTMIDYDKFTIHPGIEGPLTVFSITKGKDGNLNIERERDTLEHLLAKYLELDSVELIRCAGGDPIDAAREQWNDGSNTLAIAPGEVVVYERNHVTNKLLEEKGIKLHKVEGTELVRGRGGPRCMSMPLIREKI